jgi:hypothetical protein
MRSFFLLLADARGLLPGATDSLHRIYEAACPESRASPRDVNRGSQGDVPLPARLSRLLRQVPWGDCPTVFELDAFAAPSDRRLADWLRPLCELPASVYRDADIEALGSILERLLEHRVASKTCAERGGPKTWTLQDGLARRRTGSHYTPRALTQPVVERALQPLLSAALARASSVALLELKVCDPAMGAAAFLCEACRQLAAHLAAIEGNPRAEGDGRQLRRSVAQRCLYGVDAQPAAVHLARLCLWLTVADPSCPLDAFDAHLVLGDSLRGLPGVATGGRGGSSALDWPRAFPEVFESPAETLGGFDAFVGNPPWVSYAGRAAQPLDAQTRGYYRVQYEAFAGYRNLQGLFIERCARLLRPGGRLGLVVPSSMSEQRGYAPTRRAHDRHAICDLNLPDYGDSFSGVFQPCMVLYSSRRAAPLAEPTSDPWPVERPDLDAVGRALLEHFSRFSPLPAELFGERGLQSSGPDTEHLAPQLDAQHRVAVRVGGDIEPGLRRAPSQYADPDWFAGRLRSRDEWQAVRLLIRQTARFPKVALADGAAFRNSILAGFDSELYPATFLLAYLNSTPLRWLHFMRNRDARQGMPQVKINHLRQLPRPPDLATVDRLQELGEQIGRQNRGISRSQQARIDESVCEAFGLTLPQRRTLSAWAKRTS